MCSGSLRYLSHLTGICISESQVLGNIRLLSLYKKAVWQHETILGLAYLFLPTSNFCVLNATVVSLEASRLAVHQGILYDDIHNGVKQFLIQKYNFYKYRMEGNFGSGKIWRIHCMNTLAEENLANCEILQVKIFRKTYSIKHSERLRHATNL